MMRKIIISIISLIFLWIGGFFYYIYYTKSYPIDTRTTTDAIIVFTGGQQRINTGISLLKAGYAPVLFISGMGSNTPTYLKNLLNEQGIAPEQVIYGVSATTTQENAAEIATFITNNRIHSIRLVTSYYHMPRALEESVRKVPFGTVIVPHAVFSNSTNYKILFKEYHKFLMIYLLKYFR